MLLNRAYPDIFSEPEAQLLANMLGPPSVARSRTRIIRADVILDQSLYLTRGMLGRYSMDRQGRRQFVGIQIAGDYFDLAAYLLTYLDHDIDALSACEIRPTSHGQLGHLALERPDLYNKLWKISLIDASIDRYWIFRLGRLAGKARVANFLTEMFVRLYARGLCSTTHYELPLSQNDLAEINGMTSVHINRLLGELRLDGLCTLSDGIVRLGNLVGLARVGHYSPEYLYLAPGISAEVRGLLGLRMAAAERLAE
ncbi:Crp/Fnr family transcriptional regulator [Paracoccus chinensis]|uniref:cAMP-binding domain of CRP or a regulatory subunit of cAMP-dependent protein kinases n=1 Tax=Paracoccus chinensis TaxID=525640 RepID=A0A1G9J9I7_9RHOB|nr:Crp/Fnr family transcriptional regulator [Paracoccus chinensis]SDL34220.1 cAMP-binding domain of CRP or a regulatory subunit of cAMP-dependent protein kinases [Paracoccus chinensis]